MLRTISIVIQLGGAGLLPTAAPAYDVAHCPSAAERALDNVVNELPTSDGQVETAVQSAACILKADPTTNWRQVNLERLRQHLEDMRDVALHATARVAPVEGGITATVTATGAVVTSIRRLMPAEIAVLEREGVYKASVVRTAGGAIVTVTSARPQDASSLQSVGFIGVFPIGEMQRQFHLAIARGQSPL